MAEHLVESFGLFLLFVLIALESSGIPLPGETALIAAGVLAARGNLNIVAVIAVASAAAIVGDNIGYWIGRTGGRRVLAGRLQRFGDRIVPAAERFFERHGPKTVFFGRFFALLRVTSAWLAGISRMPWWQFLVWNAAGGICWALLVGLVTYYAGRAAGDAISHYGMYGGLIALAALLIAVAVFHFLRRWIFRAEAGS